MELFAEFQRLALAKGLTVRDCGNGHWQVRGALLVNYYPSTTRGRRIYIAGTRRGRSVETLKEVFDACGVPPPLTYDQQKRSQNFQRKSKIRAYRRSRFCNWCGTGPLLFNQCRADHKIPRSRGGLDNDNNIVISCIECDIRRKNEMPELSK